MKRVYVFFVLLVLFHLAAALTHAQALKKIKIGYPSLSFLAGFRRCAIGIEGGDRASAESGLATMRSLAASVPQPHMGWFRLIFESAWACVQGDLQAAEQHAIHAFEVGTAAGNSDALSLFGGQLTAIRSLQGRLGELAEQWWSSLANRTASPVGARLRRSL